MRNQIFMPTLLAITVLLGCKKEVDNSDGQLQEPSANSVTKVNSMLVPSQVCDVLSFKNQAPGLDIFNVTTDLGMPVTLISGISAPAIMNSGAPYASNLDMGTPNIMYPGGVGKADPGRCDGGASNQSALGHLLILQRPNFFSRPDEADLNSPDSWIELTFPGAVTVNAIKVIDVESEENEGGTVALYNESGWIKSIPIPPTCSNGVLSINLEGTANVKKIRLNIRGSMGFDDLSFCIPRYFPCTYTQGYWKNHSEAWPVSSLVLGTNGQRYSKSQLIAILKTPVRGNGLISLAHQLIAAKLNEANGADPSAVSTYLMQADQMIGKLTIPGGVLPTALTSGLTNHLDSYNNGITGPGHCE